MFIGGDPNYRHWHYPSGDDGYEEDIYQPSPDSSEDRFPGRITTAVIVVLFLLAVGAVATSLAVCSGKDFNVKARTGQPAEVLGMRLTLVEIKSSATNPGDPQDNLLHDTFMFFRVSEQHLGGPNGDSRTWGNSKWHIELADGSGSRGPELKGKQPQYESTMSKDGWLTFDSSRHGVLVYERETSVERCEWLRDGRTVGENIRIEWRF